VVAEMNRLGIMIDVSHVSDDVFHQVIELSQTPVIASHSSARHFVPGFERNMSDEMIVRLAQKGGVMMINFGSTFISAEAQTASDAMYAAATAFATERGLSPGDPQMQAFRQEYLRTRPMPLATIEDVANHIDHAVKLAGIDHVGLGSDFEGVGPTLPERLRDVSMYPELIAVLLGRGYSESDIEKICGGNALRVWQAVEDHARQAR
jgi:membrane dipeptidase